MKKIWGIVVLIFGVTAAYAQTLDGAIQSAATEISGRLPDKATVAVVSFQSDSARLTDYVIDELNGKLANIGKIKPVERSQLDKIRAELNLNASVEISEESAQYIGHMLGAQYMILGSIDFIGNQYRVRLRVIMTKSAAIEYSFSQNIKNDTVLETLLKGGSTLADFSLQQRVAASGLNLLFGVGSFAIEKDMFGGGITATFEGVGVVSMVAGFVLFQAFDASWTDQILDSYFAYPVFVGLGAYLGGAVFGIIRAQIYHKPGSLAVSPSNGLQLNLVSLDNENMGLQVSYKWTY